MSTMINSLAVPPKHYPTWEAYAEMIDALQYGLEACEDEDCDICC